MLTQTLFAVSAIPVQVSALAQGQINMVFRCYTLCVHSLGIGLQVGKGRVKKKKSKCKLLPKGGEGVDPKVYISTNLFFEFFLFKLGVNSENRLQNEFL